MRSEQAKRLKVIAKQSVRQFPWLVQIRKQRRVLNGYLRQVGAPFRFWTENGSKPAVAAVFHCAACDGHCMAIIQNVLGGDESCGCQRIIHGCATGDKLRAYKTWRHLLTRCRNNEPVEATWLHPETGVTAFLRDVGQMPGLGYSLCRRVGSLGWIRGNTYWRRELPGVWKSTADDSWHLQSGCLKQVGATIRSSGKMAVFHCGMCNQHVIESRAQIIRYGHNRCEQCRENGRFIEWNGKRRTVSDWSRIVGLPMTVIYDRLRHGWNAEQILTTPQRAYRGPRSMVGQCDLSMIDDEVPHEADG